MTYEKIIVPNGEDDFDVEVVEVEESVDEELDETLNKLEMDGEALSDWDRGN